MLKRLKSAWDALLRNHDPGPSLDGQSNKAARVLARILIAQAYKQPIAPGDTEASHYLWMRRFDVTPVAYAAKLTKLPEHDLVSMARAAIETEMAELAVLPGSGWTPPNIESALPAITTLNGWHDTPAHTKQQGSHGPR